MKTTLIAFNSDNVSAVADTISKVGKCLLLCGVNIDRVSVLSTDDAEEFENTFSDIYDKSDNIIVFNDYAACFDVNSCVAEILGVDFRENAVSAEYSKDYCDKHGIRYIPDRSYTPSNASVIPNENGVFQPYYADYGDKTLIMLPPSWKETENIVKYYVAPYLSSKSENSESVCVYKLFGDKTVEDRISEFAEQYENVFCTICSEYSDITVIFVPKTAEFDIKALQDDFENLFYEEIYSDDDCSLAEKLLHYIGLNGYTIATAESFTSGRVGAEIVKIPGASAYFNEGITAYSNEAKALRLGVSYETLKQYGAVSEKTAKEMVYGLLSESDFGISTTGIAGPKSDNTLKPVGLCYVAAGTEGKVFCNELHLSGDRETITETGKNSALFLAIKVLREND